MNIENAAVIDRDSPHQEKHDGNLLEHIRSMRTEVGDELTDEEFTRLFAQTRPPEQAGFAFLSFCNRFVMFSVPQQDPANWYQEKGWIKPEKEEIVKKIGEKYGFSFCEPPDTKTSSSDAPNPHHHMQLCNPQEAIVIVHPQFLKVRLFTLASHSTKAQKPLKKCELLKDLSALYQS